MRTLLPYLFAAATVGCSQPNANYELLANRKIQCPAGSQLQYEPWGESGMQAVCILKHGPVVIAEHGHIKIEGQNEMGKQVGEWRWLDASGKVTHTEQYGEPKP